MGLAPPLQPGYGLYSPGDGDKMSMAHSPSNLRPGGVMPEQVEVRASLKVVSRAEAQRALFP